MIWQHYLLYITASSKRYPRFLSPYLNSLVSTATLTPSLVLESNFSRTKLITPHFSLSSKAHITPSRIHLILIIKIPSPSSINQSLKKHPKTKTNINMARYYNSYLQYLSPPPAQLCFFIMVVLLLLGFSWYINYESMWEDLMDQLKLFFMIFPVLLILVVHWLSTSEDRRLLIPSPGRETIHRVGGSPWGVALLLIFLIYMISHHRSLKETWWPLLAR